MDSLYLFYSQTGNGIICLNGTRISGFRISGENLPDSICFMSYKSGYLQSDPLDPDQNLQQHGSGSVEAMTSINKPQKGYYSCAPDTNPFSLSSLSGSIYLYHGRHRSPDPVPLKARTFCRIRIGARFLYKMIDNLHIPY